MTRITKQQQADSIDALFSVMGIVPGDTIYTSHHGSNGTFLKLFVVKNGEILNITSHAAKALGTKPKDKDGSWVLHNPVYGMDRGFDVVYRLSHRLFKDHPEVEKGDAGYTLNHRWL